jgi:hypothetical protein
LAGWRGFRPANTMKVLALVTLLSGIVILLLSLPLAFRRMPRNRHYGFCFAKALQSDESWYAINEYGGKRMAIWALFLTAAGVAGFFISPRLLDYLSYATAFAAPLAMIVPFWQTYRWSHRNDA